MKNGRAGTLPSKDVINQFSRLDYVREFAKCRRAENALCKSMFFDRVGKII